MIEMLGVLAIVGVLSAGGIAGYSMAMQSYKTNQLIDKINLMVTRARQVYKGNYTGLSCANLVSAGKLTDCNSPFGGVIDIVRGYNGETYFSIHTTNNIPAEACVDLLSTYWGPDGVFLAITVSGYSDFGHSLGNYPPAFSTIVSQCAGGNKKISWSFK